MNDLCILVHSKDCYRDTLDENLDALKKHGLDKFPIAVTTEHKTCFKVKHSIITGDGTWSDRLRPALRELYKAGYRHVLFFLEDMIVKKVDHDLLRQAIEFHYTNQNSCTKLGRHWLHNIEETGLYLGPHKILNQTKQPYIISHQPAAIFEIEFLFRTVYDSVTPWEHELVTNQVLSQGLLGPYKVMIVGSNPANVWQDGTDFGEIIEYHHCLNKGQRIPYVGKY